MLVIADRVKETTVTVGVGPLALAGAMTGFRTFASVCAIGDTCFYAVQAIDATGAPAADWEVGLGTYSGAATFTRTTPQASSNGGAAVNFAAGTKQVWIDLSATQLGGLATNASLSAYATIAYVDAGDAGLAAAVALKAPLASPALTGTPTGTTAAADTNTTQLATTAFVIGQGYAKLASPALTGTPTSPTAAVDTNTTQVATTAFVIAQAYAKLASPALTGTPTAPTAAPATNSTQLATTAYVDTLGALKAPLASPTFTGTATAAALTATGLVTEAGEDSITAHAGGGKASATALSATVNLHRIATCVTAADSILMPPALAGQAHYLRHDGAAAAQIFGQGTDTINGVATGTGIAHGAGVGLWYVCTTAGAWTTTFALNNLDGSAASPVLHGANTPTSGFYFSGASPAVTISGTLMAFWDATNFYLNTAGSNITLCGASNGADDSRIAATAANSLRFSAANNTVTSRTETNKSVTAIADAVATAILTITVPNAAHSASLKLRLTGSLGAGGAIGANEASAAIEYDIAIARTAGVNAVATISAAYGSAAAAVAGAATVTCTAAMSAVSGAVGASNTFTVNVTITRSGGASTNHTCLVYAQLMNANATGVTIA